MAQCSEFRSTVRSTYNFAPSKLTKAQQKKKSAEMDAVWKMVEAHPAEMTPCLVAEMEEPTADHWFLFDAGGLLQKLDRSPHTNELILLGCERVELDDVQLEDWLRRLTSLALLDVNISAAAGRWMHYPRSSYILPQHAFTVTRADGAFFLYGSMDEEFAATALLKIASNPADPERELALSLLGSLATPEADRAFLSVDLSRFPERVQASARSAIAHRPVFVVRSQPRLRREEIVAAFQSAADRRDFAPFMELVEKVPDGERDVVALMTSADLPLIRRVRRAIAASGNPDLMEDYPYFTGIIWTLQGAQR